MGLKLEIASFDDGYGIVLDDIIIERKLELYEANALIEQLQIIGDEFLNEVLEELK